MRRRHRILLPAALAVVALVLTLAGRHPAEADAATASKRASSIPTSNGTWAYDAGHPGRWSGAIADYNASAAATHQLGVVMSYGTDLEMYCPNRDPARCTPDDVYSYYTPGSSGRKSTAAYARQLPGASISPIVDGQIGASYLTGFNELSPGLASAFADKVAAQFCADAHVGGVQFDLEPFDVRTQNGQFAFYRRIASDFAGGTPACVDATHPAGRFFSIFTFAGSLAPGSASAQNIATMFGDFGNGYVIDSLYDLSRKPGGYLSSPATYTSNAQSEAAAMVRGAHAIGVRYGFGIPGGASAHEYSACTGGGCHPDATGHTGYPMLRYVSAALPAVAGSGARADPLFCGMYLWYFGLGPQQHPGYATSPAPVRQSVLDYLSTRL